MAIRVTTDTTVDYTHGDRVTTAPDGTLQVRDTNGATIAEHAPGQWSSWREFGARVEQVDPAVKELAGKVAADAGIDQARWGRFSVADLVAAYRQGRTDLTNTLNGALDEAAQPTTAQEQVATRLASAGITVGNPFAGTFTTNGLNAQARTLGRLGYL